MKKVLLLCTLWIFPLLALADRDFGMYLGSGLGFINTNAEDAFEGPVSFKVGEVFGGVHWRWLGAELRYGRSLADEIIDVGVDADTGEFVTASTSLESFVTVFSRFQLENDISRVYVLLGQSYVNSNSTFSTGESTDILESGYAYGIGAGFEVNKRLFFNIEYKSLFESEELSLPMIGATLDLHIF